MIWLKLTLRVELSLHPYGTISTTPLNSGILSVKVFYKYCFNPGTQAYCGMWQ